VRINRYLLTLTAIVLAVAVGALAGNPAAAQTSKPTPGTSRKPTPPTTRRLPSDPNLPAAVVNSWALSPTGAKPGEPGTRPNLSYELAPGAQVQDSVTLFNYSNVQLTFRVYATDAFNNVDGQFDVLTGDKNPSDVGAWVTLPQANITVAALASATLPITVTVPPDAGPGDHTGGIIAASQAEGTGPDGKVITLDRRTGSRMYIRVAGPLTPKLDVDKLRSTYHPALNPLSGSVGVAYTVRNRGNVRLAATQGIAVLTLFGIGLDRMTPVDIPELLPGNSVTLHASFHGVPATLLLFTKISLTPITPRDTSSPPATGVSRTSRTLALPWTVLAILLVAGAGLKTRKAYRRHRAGAGSDMGLGAPNARSARRMIALSVLGALAASVAAVLPAQAADAPSFTVTPGETKVGDRVVARFVGWTSAAVTVQVCGNLGLRGAPDCDQIGGQGIGLSRPGPSLGELTVTRPPVSCPCVVRASSAINAEVLTAPLVIAGVPVGPVRGPDDPTPLVAVTLNVTEARHGLGGILRPLLGGRRRHTATVTLRNTSTVTLAKVTLGVAVGRAPGGDQTVPVPPVTPLKPGESRRYVVPTSLSAPTWGRYHWTVTVDGAGPEVSATATTSASPWLLYLLLVVLITNLVGLAALKLRRRRERGCPKIQTDKAKGEDKAKTAISSISVPS